MKNKINTNKLLAYIWLGVGILSLGLGIHKTLLVGFKDSYMFFIIVFLGFAMFFLRKNIKPPKEE